MHDSHTNTEGAEEESKAFVKKSLAGSGRSSSEARVRKNKEQKQRADSGNAVDGFSKKTDRRIEKELLQIYENSDGTLPDMHHISRGRRMGVIKASGLLAASFLFLVAVVSGGFFFFQPQKGFSEDDVIVSVSGDAVVPIGTIVTYRIRYRNNQDVPLLKTTLRVRYPAGFSFENSSREASDSAHDEWALGSIESGGSGYIDITGRLYGNVREDQSFRVFLSYTPSNFSSEFQKAASATVSLSDPSVDISVEGSGEVVVGADTSLVIVVKRSKNDALQLPPLSVVVTPPAHFTKKNSTPASDAHDPFRWAIKDGALETRIILSGVFADAEGVTSTAMRISLAGRKPGDKTGDIYTYASRDVPFIMAERDVAARLVVNGSMGDLSVAPGDEIHATISVENNGPAALRHVQLRAVFDAPSWDNKSILDWGKLQDTHTGSILGEQISPRTRRGSITWTAKEMSEFSSIAAGAHADLDIVLPVKTSVDEHLADATSTILAVAEIQYDGAHGKEILQGNRILLTLHSDTKLSVRDKADTDSAGATTHAVTWLLSNSFHDLKNIELSTEVYGDARWVSRALSVPAGKVVFDEKNKTVTWNIDQMPRSVDVLPLQFSLTVDHDNPTQQLLTGKVKGKATDAVTGQEIALVGSDIALHE